jgi:hypothetical protein
MDVLKHPVFLAVFVSLVLIETLLLKGIGGIKEKVLKNIRDL